MKSVKEFIKGFLPYFIVGGIFGFIIGFAGLQRVDLRLLFNDSYTFFGYLGFVLAIITFIISVILIINCKKNINKKNVDLDKMECKLDLTITFSGLSLLFVLLGFGLLFYELGKSFFDFSNLFNLVLFITFVLICIVVSFIQYITIEYYKKINPEKRGNAMSSNFQKDWYNSCDEGQRKIIGEVCYKSFILTNSIYTFLFIILVIVAPILKLGSFSILLFGFVNILNLSVYCFTAYKIEHRKK